MRMRFHSLLVVLPLLIGAAGCPEEDPPLPAACTGEPDGCTEETCVIDPGQPGYGSCGGDLYECQDGEWIRVGYCEPAPLSVDGTWTLALAVVDSDPCPAFDITETLVLHATEGDSLQVTCDDPAVTIDGADAEVGFASSTVEVTLTDSWENPEGADVAPSLLLSLELSWDGTITGSATTSFPYDTATAGTTCRYVFDVTGTRTPE